MYKRVIMYFGCEMTLNATYFLNQSDLFSFFKKNQEIHPFDEQLCFSEFQHS